MALFPDTDVQYIKGVGPRLGQILKKRGVYSVDDLLQWYPRAYEDRRAIRNIASLKPEDVVSLEVQVLRKNSFSSRYGRRKIYEVIVGDSSGQMACRFFRPPYKGFFEQLEPGLRVKVTGKAKVFGGRLLFMHPEILPLKPEEKVQNDLLPIYTETEGLSPNKLRRLIRTALSECEFPRHWVQKPRKGIPDFIPQWILEKYHLLSREEALKKIHFPDPKEAAAYLEKRSAAHRRLIFEEFFSIELLMAQRRLGIQKEKAFAMKKKAYRLHDFISHLPFELTGAQKRVLKEIVEDMRKEHPMQRLVQGDVGSGKTMVALMAALVVADNGFQTALMAPTEILAEQHYKNARKVLEPLGVKVGLLTGKQKPREKQEIVSALKAGEIQLCVGTHALIQENVLFQSLGLVIVDEQHRFGVAQRRALKKNFSPHFLVMTATPIPRTLALTIYGDLDISIIDEMPKGRQPIVTRCVYENKRPKVMEFLEAQVSKGRQAYIVYPLVEESEKIDLKDAETQFEFLSKTFPQFSIGLLHGKMKAVEKESVMRRFRQGEIQILVTTTVVEVGVDVPNATLMIVEHAERFGLSQLHQLRGRVGRGSHKSYCVLMMGRAVSEESRLRAQVMEQTNDGFRIAEADLEIRGPGEFLGKRQSGLPGFKMANLVRDLPLLKLARQAAFEVLEKDPHLEKKEHQFLKQHLMALQEKDLVG
ncbi:MAG: ATP-dependent DNA helicase RecG [Bdellovibrio sp.]|nr:MAG: ATP-dependent DNA helicase RecG [Bdellovibrio sp.]